VAAGDAAVASGGAGGAVAAALAGLDHRAVKVVVHGG
jgi:hypothetical protein